MLGLRVPVTKAGHSDRRLRRFLPWNCRKRGDESGGVSSVCDGGLLHQHRVFVAGAEVVVEDQRTGNGHLITHMRGVLTGDRNVIGLSLIHI